MTEYTLRNDKGIMVAKIGGVVADKILRDGSGFWRNYNTKDNGTKRCYEFSDDFSFSLAGGDDRNVFQMFLWKGYVLVEKY